MPGPRFVTVRDLYEAFPAARQDVGREPSDEPSLAFLNGLVANGAFAQAMSYCVYLLPRREAVWWGCETLRRLIPNQSAKDEAALEAAEAWVFQTDEARRIEALTVGTQGDGRSPATWMARAAGWSGGNVVPPELGSAPAPPDQTARALRAGLLIALAHISKGARPNYCRPVFETALDWSSGIAFSRRQTAKFRPKFIASEV